MNINNANLKFRNLNYGNNPKSIVLHHAEASNCTIEDIHNWHLQNGWAGCGYHYFVRKNGKIYKGRPDECIGAHVVSFNKDSLGICAEGSYMSETMPQVQKQAIIELCKYLCDKYGITKIYGHGEVGSSNCPGTNYPLNEIRNTVLNGNTSTSANRTYLQKGDRGDNVKHIQEMLIKIGYPVGKFGADGVYGDGTVNAIKCFQRDCNLSIDGLCGTNTKAKIEQEYNKKIGVVNRKVEKNVDTDNKIYRVQVGAFKNKDNVEILLKELKSKGFEGFIKEE